MTMVQNFVFQDGFIYVEHQDELMRLGRSNGTEVRFSSFNTMAEINYLSCTLKEQSLLEIQKYNAVQSHFLYIGIIVGTLIGYFLLASHLIAIAILLFALQSPLYFWFQLQEKSIVNRNQTLAVSTAYHSTELCPNPAIPLFTNPFANQIQTNDRQAFYISVVIDGTVVFGDAYPSTHRHHMGSLHLSSHQYSLTHPLSKPTVVWV